MLRAFPLAVPIRTWKPPTSVACSSLVAGFLYALLVLLIYVLIPAARGIRLRRRLIAALLPAAQPAMIVVAAIAIAIAG